MEILKKNNFIIALIFIININYISSNKGICTTIEHCLRCPKEDKCLICKFGYRLNKNRTECILREHFKSRKYYYKRTTTSKKTTDEKDKDNSVESSNILSKSKSKNILDKPTI